MAIADLSASETRKIDAADLIEKGVSSLIPDGVIPAAKIVSNSITATQIAPDAVTASELANDAVDTNAIVNAAVTGAKIASDTITAANIAANAITASELADDAVDTAAIVDEAVTGAKIAAASITTTHIADNAIDTAQIAANAVNTAAVAPSAITNAKLAGGITQDKLAGGITYGQLNISDNSIPGTKITDNSITATQLAADCVGASELANDAVDTGAIVNGAVTNAKLASGIDGAKLTAGTVDGDALVNTSVDAAKLDTATIGRGLNVSASVLGHSNSVTAGTTSGITFDAQGHITATTALVGSDLPLATTTTIGGVSVPASSELTVSGTGELQHADSITAGVISGITYNSAGHITAVTPLVGSDLPNATTSTVGAVSVPGDALNVSAGVLTHLDSGAAAGTYTKVTVDARGHVTFGDTLIAADIPNLDASKITSGTFGSAFLADNSVTAQQLADYGIAQVSETQPTPEFAGQWWINPSDRSAYIWVGTVTPTLNGYWLLVGYGSPTQLNLRFGGTYNANTNTIVSLNEYGVEAGLSVGQALAAPNASNNGVYLVVTTAGTGTSPAPAVSFSVGDWVLSQGTGATWTKVAVVSGAAGTVNDYDVLCDGTYFTPDMTAVADVRAALALIWGRVQIATTSQEGIVRESTEILVDDTTGEMTVGVVDDGTY